MPSSMWSYASNSGIIIPAGLITPFDDIAANIPAGWEQWTLAANTALKGAVAAGTTGGASSINRYTATEGSHTGTNFTAWGGGSAGSTVDRLGGASGDHSHTVSISFAPTRRLQVLMKALADTRKFPAKAGILSDVALADLTNITPTGHLLCGASGASSSNIAASSSVSFVDTAGGHDHLLGAAPAVSPGSAAQAPYGQGAHNHSGTPSVTDNIYRYYMGLWSSAASDIAVIKGVYGIWESATPPPGWAICDGTNGTPDLRGYFIGFDSGAVMGTKSGDGTITTSASLSTSGAHAHNGTVAARNSTVSTPHSNIVTHSHSVGALASAFEPLNRTVVFIKAIG